ncbi:glycosyltransferase family 4 protein [Arthrobacter sp. NPDC090010]|uniref:glycosyltransferase family 4 protein n=1 Tax=Arthrobacter sp. NPDC090010 TaxID=3363942 RepID=UPI0037F26785
MATKNTRHLHAPADTAGDGRPRVLLLTHSYWPEHSPPQRRWGAFAREFSSQGWSLHVVAPLPHEAGRRESPSERAVFRTEKGPHGERVMRVPYLRHRNSTLSKFLDQSFSALLSVPATFRLPQVDIVVATAPSLPTLATGFLVARLRRIPLVVEMRDAWPDLARDARLVKGRVKSLVEWAVEFVQQRATVVVTVTEGFAQTLRDRGLRSVVCISNGVRVDSLPVLEDRGGGDSPFTAVYLGNLGKSQRLDVAIRAAALVGPAMRLHIVGHGVEQEALRRLAEELGAPVTFHGTLHGPELMDRYAGADTCLVSLRDDWKSFETTVPSKLYEVLALGRHVTAVVRGEAARIVEEAQAGHIVACHPEPLAELWTHLAANRDSLGRPGGGRAWVREHADHPMLARQYMELITRTLAEQGGRGRETAL